MKSKRFLLLLMLAVASPWMMKAQTTVTIGDGEATHQMLPIHTYKEYSLSQQIYTAAEIGGAGTITSIALYHDNAVPPGRFEMYLVHTNKTAFDTNGFKCALTLVSMSVGFALCFAIAHYIRKAKHNM